MQVIEYTQGDAIGLREMNVNHVTFCQKTIDNCEKAIEDTEEYIVTLKGKAEYHLKSGNIEFYESIMNSQIPNSKRLIASYENCISDCTRAIIDSNEKIKGYDKALASGKLSLNYTIY